MPVGRDLSLTAGMLSLAALLMHSMLPSDRVASAVNSARRASARMGVMQDVEKWITENVGPIESKRGVGGVSASCKATQRQA